MQVDLVADGKFAAPQPAQDRLGDAIASKREFIAGFDIQVVGVECQRIRKDLRFIGAARSGPRPPTLALRHALRRVERPDAAHGGAK
ncbi:MAG TPA: hypothetical protein VIG03_06265 [Steroidobacteraceae bacterium]|jgi:hypothetical protein